MSVTPALPSLAEEIKCYSLPYGALGFVSHVLTYYTILCLWFGRKPLWPFSRVTFSRFDLALGAFGLLISTLLSIVTIVSCKDTWQLLVIAVWKMSMSLLNGVTAVHVAILFIMKKVKLQGEAKEAKGSREASDDSAETIAAVDEAQIAAWRASDGRGGEEEPARTEAAEVTSEKEGETPITVVINPMRWVSWWVVPYIPGMFAGVAGLMSLVVKSEKHASVRKLTAGFYTIVGAGVLIIAIGLAYRLRRRDEADGQRAKKIILGGLIWAVATFSILAVFYSDWALGMMTGNITGLPSGDATALYWTYWISKRLPMLSW